MFYESALMKWYPGTGKLLDPECVLNHLICELSFICPLGWVQLFWEMSRFMSLEFWGWSFVN